MKIKVRQIEDGGVEFTFVNLGTKTDKHYEIKGWR